MSKKTKGIILIILGISLALLALFILNSDRKLKEINTSISIPEKQNGVEPPPNLPFIKEEEQNSNQILSYKYESKNNTETNVYDFMNQMQNESKIAFKDKTYAGMGKFIEEINGKKNGEKNWIYYVNNIKANIGISNYKIKSGDVVSWKYE